MFESLSQEELEYVFLNSTKRNYKKNSVITSEQNKRNYIYVIQSGKVKLYKTSRQGHNIILSIKSKGDFVGLSTLFSDSSNPSTIETIEDSTIYNIKTTILEELILSNSNLAKNIITTMGKHLVSAQNNARDLALDDSYTKIIKMIISLSKQHGSKLYPDSTKIELNLDLTRSELASFVGISRETLSRALSQLNQEGYIDIEDKKIIVTDILKLEECLL